MQTYLARPALDRTPGLVLHPPVFPSDYATEGRGSSLTLVGYDRLAYKGMDVFFALARALPDEQFLLVADDADEALPPNVRMQAITADMRSVYAQTKLLLMPSMEETYGRVSVEAAMSGIPTVASVLPGIGEATAGHATLVGPAQSWEVVVRDVLATLDSHRKAARELAGLRDPTRELNAFGERLQEVVANGRRRPTLTLCMTVSNEASTLARAIRSVAPAVDEIVIGVDERSEDETMEIARDLATHVFTFTESSPPDFARMRNRALKRVETDWAIVLDGHEWIEQADCIRPALETTAWSIEARILFEPDENRVPGLSFPYPKIHRRHVRFVGPTIHEEVSTPLERRDSRTDIKIWHERKPGRATALRSEEKAGAELDALRETWEGQGDRRALFYLANGLREAGRHEEAIVAYQKYLEAPNWPEEGWQARLFLARCNAAREDRQEARHTFEQAVLQCPERAEGLVGLAYTLLELDEPRTAATWFRMATTLPEPEGCRLFVEVPIYRWGAWHGLALALDRLGDRSGAIEAERRALAGGAGSWAQQNIDLWVGGATEREPWRPLFDLGVHAFYAGEMKAGRDACERLLALADVPDEVRLQTRRNQIFYAPRLPDLAPSTVLQEIMFETQEGWSRFNPSIAASDDGYLMIVRSSNYTVDNWMRYRMNDGDQVIRTTNYLLTLDDNLSMQGLEVIEDQTDRQGTFPFPVSGFEDCRLFRHRGLWHASATTREHDPEGLCRVALLRLHESAFTALQLLAGPAPGRHEKNWMPIVTSDGLCFMYSCRPTIVLRCDEATGEIEEVARKPGPLIAEHFRGGSQAVEVQGGYLFVVHESVDFEDGGRVCPHRFIFLDQAFNITHISPQFFFLDRALEFCTGLALRGELLTASFGYADREAHVASTHLGEILAMLQPVSGGWCPFPKASSVPTISVDGKPALLAGEGDHRSVSPAALVQEN